MRQPPRQPQGKSSRNKNFYKASSLALAIVMIAAACTKNKELSSTVDPDFYQAKDYFVGSNYSAKVSKDKMALGDIEFHLSRGIEDADSDNDIGATPGMSTDYGLVRARIFEDQIQFVQSYDPSVSDQRASTENVVASFKIEKQFDVNRDKNDFGDQTNKVIEDQKSPWENRQFMRVDWSQSQTDMTSFGKNLAGEKTTGAGSGDEASSAGAEENSHLLENPNYEPQHFSVLVQTSVRSNHSAQYTFPMSISAPKAYQVAYRWHLTKVAPSDFEPVPYSLKDFSRFGYFFAQHNVLNPQGLKDSGITLYANAHNVCEPGRAGSCSTNQIRWVLSKDFPDKYKAMARKVIGEWNQTFKDQLNRQDDVVVLDESVQATISDPTMNVLAYYPNRTKSGLLGVAQWISNPRTGELNGVRATIYGDGIDYEVSTVDDKINLLVSDDPLKDVIGTSGFGSPLTYVSPYDAKNTAKMMVENRNVLGLNVSTASGMNSFRSPSLVISSTLAKMNTSPMKSDLRMVTMATKAREIFAVKEASLVQDEDDDAIMGAFPKKLAGADIPDLNGMEKIAFSSAKVAEDKKNIIRDAELGIHGTELVEDAVQRYLLNFIKKNVKTPADLEAARQEIEDQVAQLTFYTTALHEMGHTFGLRHNFMGSADQKHYASKYFDVKNQIDAETQAIADGKLTEEARTVAVEDLDPYASSSIMDYGRDFFSQEGGLGPYDKAAIKYVYNRSIDKESDPVTLANYMFCTDHQVGEDLLCQRFDKGHNLSEMVQGDIDLYDHSYAMWHYRRGRVQANLMKGWGNPRTLMRTLLQRVFLPTRQVMDEFMFQLIAAKPIDSSGSYCSLPYVKGSIAAGEMQDICSDAAMAAAGVTGSDVSTFINALFARDANGKATGFLKDPSTYIPYGMADLLYSNQQAMMFFQRVLGAPEPGTYIAVPQVDGSFHLASIDPAQPIADQAKEIATTQQLPPAVAAKFVTLADQLVTEIKVGGYGREYQSHTSTVGGWIRNESIGSFWDKYAALQALTTQNLGVEKYYTGSSILVGNAYFFPQSKAYTTALMNKLVTGNKFIANVPITLKNSGQVLMASPPAEFSLDIQGLAAMFAVAGMTSDTDRTMLGKMQICDINQGECSQSTNGMPVVQFSSADGGNVYRAVQTDTKDSIAYNLLTQAKKADDERKKWVAVRDGSGAIQAKNIMTLSSADSDALLAKMLTEVATDPTLKAFQFKAQGQDSGPGFADILPDAWNALKNMTANLNSLSFNQGYQMGLYYANAMGALEQQTNIAYSALKTSGACWVAKTHPEAVPKEEQSGAPKTADQFAAFLEAKAENQPTPVVVNPAAPAADCDATADQAAGAVRYNLLLLKADIAKINADYIPNIVIANINSLQAPLLINRKNNDLRIQESTIDSIHKLLYEISH